MTILNTYQYRNGCALEEYLIKNLPSRIKAGTEKTNSNINELPTIVALKKCPFMNFNTFERVSIMVFDIDSFNDVTAKEYFKDIDGLYEHIMDKLTIEPTYILETDKGFHFGFGLKNHVFTHQKKAATYLRDIKKAIAKLLGCDPMASNRLYGVWRNPLLHKHYFSQQFNYELNDFKEFLPKRNWQEKRSFVKGFDVNKVSFEAGKRNNNLFYCGLVFANNFSELTEEQVFQYIIKINEDRKVGLDESEIKKIAYSIYNRYWLTGKICLERDINVGAMGFKTIPKCTYGEYLVELKKRQQLSIQRTLKIRDEEKNHQSLKKANRRRIDKLKNVNIKKVKMAINELKKEGIKVTNSAISKKCKLDRRTVKKYI